VTYFVVLLPQPTKTSDTRRETGSRYKKKEGPRGRGMRGRLQGVRWSNGGMERGKQKIEGSVWW
jgi:hypothetical protein